MEFALSLASPYREMGKIEKTSPAQREPLVGLYEDYCAAHSLAASYLPDEEIRLKCLAARGRTVIRKGAEGSKDGG